MFTTHFTRYRNPDLRLVEAALQQQKILPSDIATHITDIIVENGATTIQRTARQKQTTRRNKKINDDNLNSFYNNLVKLERALRTFNLSGVNGVNSVKQELLDFMEPYQYDDNHTRIPGIIEKFEMLKPKLTSITDSVPEGNENKELRSLISAIMHMIYRKIVSSTRWLAPPRSERASLVHYPPMGEGLKRKPKPKPKPKTKTKKARKARPKK